MERVPLKLLEYILLSFILIKIVSATLVEDFSVMAYAGDFGVSEECR
ncbi:MAG: hypothetical protein ACE5IT_02460 [bacterium]